MKNEIKQQIEKESEKLFPKQIHVQCVMTGALWKIEAFQKTAFEKGAEYGYGLAETKIAHLEIDLMCEKEKVKQAIQSASQQQEKENDVATTITVGKRTIDLGNKGILTIDVKSDAVEFTEWLFENEWKKGMHTHPNKVGQYWSNRHCKYIPIQQLYEIFKQSKTK